MVLFLLLLFFRITAKSKRTRNTSRGDSNAYTQHTIIVQKTEKISLKYRYWLPELAPWLTFRGSNYQCFYGSKDVRAFEVRLYIRSTCRKKCKRFLCFKNKIQWTLFIPTLDTTTKFVIMTIWLSRNLSSIGDSEWENMQEYCIRSSSNILFWIFVRIASLRRF